MAGQVRVGKLVDGYARNTHSAGRRHDVRQQSAANFKTVQLAQFVIGLNRAELENLVEGSVGSRGFRVVEDETHSRPLAACYANRFPSRKRMAD